MAVVGGAAVAGPHVPASGAAGRARPGEVANFGRDGGLRTKIRIVGDDEEDRRQRDERRKAQREAKRADQRERLARLWLLGSPQQPAHASPRVGLRLRARGRH